MTVCEEASRTIRTTTHNYIKHIGDAWDTDGLYDLTTDPDETHNLIHDNPDTATTLHDRLTAINGPDALV